MDDLVELLLDDLLGDTVGTLQHIEAAELSNLEVSF
jgi:hypothetical protein